MAGWLLTPLCALALLGAVLATCPNTNWLTLDGKCYLPLSVPPFSEVMEEDARAMCMHIHPTSMLPEVYDSDDLLVVSQKEGAMLLLIF